MDIRLIPYGAEHAISRERLCQITGLSDSTMRVQLSKLKTQYPICSSCHYQGYFRPIKSRPAEIKMAESCRKELKNKAISMLAQLKVLDNFVDAEESLEQLTLF